jgi:hypothetical protein
MAVGKYVIDLLERLFADIESRTTSWAISKALTTWSKHDYLFKVGSEKCSSSFLKKSNSKIYI